MLDFQTSIGDICRDTTGLRVRVEDVDIYDYVHFSVIPSDDAAELQGESGEMSHVAFVHRFTRLSSIFDTGKVA